MLRSPPSRRRGLKSCIQGIWINTDVVASFAEAWIEIALSLLAHSKMSGRLLRGGVD